MILCCGESLIDMIPMPTRDGPDGYVPHVGGAVLNTAVALGRLETRTALLTGLSSDAFGEQIAQSLRDSNVDTSYAVTSDRPTTLAFVHLTDGHASYAFFDENSATRMIGPGDLATEGVQADALFFGGISLCNAPVADTLADLAARQSDAVIMLDPNMRPGFATDVAAYRARLNRLIGLADIVKLSDDDLDLLFPDASDHRARLSEIQQMGPKVVILTRGSAGALALAPNGARVDVGAPEVTPVDTVGAGDAFNAGVLAKLQALDLLDKPAIATLSDEALRVVLAYAARVAALTVTRSGANPPWAHEL